MNFEFLLPIIGGFSAYGLTKALLPKENKKENLVSVMDEIPITDIKNELVYTQTNQIFKVIRLQGQSVAGKKASELEKAFISRSLFFRNISENKVQLRIVSTKHIHPVIKKRQNENAVLNELVNRWENKLDKSFKTKHFIIVSGTNEGEIDAVIKEAFINLSELNPNVLSGLELLKFLSSIYNYKEFEINNVNEIAQSRIEIDNKGIITEQYAGSEKFKIVFGIKDIGDSVNSKIIDSLLSLPYEMTLSVHLLPINKTQAISNLDKRIMQLNLGKKEINLSTNEEIKELKEQVENNKLSLIETEFTILITLDNEVQIEQAALDVYSVLGKSNIRPVLEERLSMPKFWGQCPGRDAFNRELLLTSNNLADLCPLNKAETGLNKCDWGNLPVCYFPSVPSGNPFGFTFHATSEDQAPPHCCVFAPTGSGKTVLILHLVSQALAAYPDLSVFMLDRDNGVTCFTELLGGVYHQISQEGNISLNPFDCDIEDETNLNMFLQILTNAETEQEKSDIRLFVEEILKQPITNRRMDVYYNELVPNGVFKDKLKKWVYGNTLNAKLFNGSRDTLNVGNNRLNVFGLDNIKDDPNAAAALFFYLFKKIEKNAKTGKPSLLIVDEAPTLLSSPALKAEIEKLLKTARKQRMAIFMAFQGTNDLKQLNIKETILTNCHTRFFYDGCAGTLDEIDGFNLTESETEFVLTRGAKIEGAKRPILMQRQGVNVFLDTDMSCLGNYINAFKGGAKTVHFMEYAKKNSDNPYEYYLKHLGENR
ncbi:MAG: DUF87 domain-containing protein [Alphaproteobacteria bacterium]|nr:DUF87 domain-containing protein [Alphaproteobacteria bacterium]